MAPAPWIGPCVPPPGRIELAPDCAHALRLADRVKGCHQSSVALILRPLQSDPAPPVTPGGACRNSPNAAGEAGGHRV